MNTVEPIRDVNLIYDIADYLRVRNERDYVMFLFGIYSALRITDILKLRIRDIKGKDYIYIRENKTQKEKRFPINKELKEILEEYISDKKDYEYLFKSRQGLNKPITRTRAYEILRNAAKEFGLYNIGTHTMRKTWGWITYQETKDVVAIQEILNHGDPSTTLRYIGVTQDTKDKVMMSFSLKDIKRRIKRGDIHRQTG